ncbi:uncharacterized protein LOC131879738 isoform X3 [Tigriopus californicus]|uniref:uncharacterized protein LOC131879738 isoform X3 n=1 Tax=Tigriopus californicus TaxID=6832 RepID=UPI0027DA2CE9|nr:uncharacterized protein LOC131879738 isoform X3 [Tigriopus californicus]
MDFITRWLTKFFKCFSCQGFTSNIFRFGTQKERKTDMPGSETVPAAWRAWVNTNPAESAPQEVINPSEEQGKRSVIYIELANNSPAIKRRTQDAAPGNNKENKGDSRKPSVTPRISGENVERKYTVQTRTSDIVDVDKVISESLGGNGIHAKRVDEPPVQGRSFADKRSAQKTSVPKSALRESFLKAKDKFAGMNSASSKPPEPISLPKALEEKLVTTWKANQIKSPLELNDAHGSGMDPRKLLRLQSLDFESSVKNLSDGPQSPYTPDWDDQTGPNFQRTYSLVYKPVYAGKSVVSYSSSIRAKNITGKYRHAKNNQPVMKELKFHNFEEITDTDAPTLMRAESFSTPTLKRPKSDVMVYEIEETPNGPQSSTPHIDMPSLDDVEATRRVKPEDLDLTESNPELGHPSEFSSPKFIDRFSFITSPKPYKSFDSKSNSSQPSCSESDGPLWSPESFVQSRGLSLNAKDSIGKDIARAESCGTSTSSAAPVHAPAALALAPTPSSARPGMESVENGLRAAPGAPEHGVSSSLLAAKEDSCDGVADPLVTIPGQKDEAEEVVQRQAAADDGNFESVQPKTGSLKHKTRKKKKSSGKKRDVGDSSLRETENQSAADVAPNLKMGPRHIFMSEEIPSRASSLNQSIDKIDARDNEDVGSKEKVEHREKDLAFGMSRRKTSYAHTAILERERAGFPASEIKPAYSEGAKEDCLRIERNSILRKEARNILDLVMSLDSESYGHATNAPTDKPPDTPNSRELNQGTVALRQSSSNGSRNSRWALCQEATNNGADKEQDPSQLSFSAGFQELSMEDSSGVKISQGFVGIENQDNTSIREETAMDLVESSLPVPVHHRHSVSQDSNDSSSSSPGTILPPTYSRLPPDGHEFPPDYKDPSSLTSQNSLLLTRKSSSESNSSDQSQNKKGIMDFPRIKMQKIQLIRHDENSIKSVRDKIALFSSACSSQSTEDLGLSQLGRNPPNTGLLTRAHTHGDVRYVGNDSKRSGIYHQSMTNVSASHGGSLFHRETKSISSTSLINSEPRPSRSRLSHGTGHTPTPQERHGRSQSLLEIGSTNASVKSPDGSSTLPKRHHPQPARRATLTTSTPIKKSDIKIIHENSPCLDSKELSEAKQIDLSGDRLKLSSTSSPNGRSSNKFSPAFKHKAFTIYSNTSSPSPPSSLKTDEKDVSSQFRNVPITQTGSPYQDEGDGPEDPRVLKRNSVEAINRRNILESAKKSSGTKLFGDPTPIQATKTSISDFRAIEAREVGKMGLTPARSITSLGKPASRSSSFTIAERKKSFETVSGTRTALESRRGPHSSQDSLRSAHSKENFNDASSTCSRRSSRDTICEEELLPSYSRRSSRSEADGGSRVTTPTRTHPLPGVDEGSRSTTPLGRRTLSRNNSLTSERSTYSKRSGASSKNGRDKTTLPTAAFPEQEKLSRNNSNDSGTSSNVLDLDLPIPTGGFSRLSSAVSSKDSGFPESEKSSFSRLSSIASVDEESLVSSPNTTPSVNNDKWSTLEKKYSISTQSMISTDTKTKIAQFSKTNTSTSSPVSSNATTSVRPTELNFHSVKSASNSPPPSLPLKKTSSTTTLVASPVSSRNFRELTEKFESKTSESATSSRRASITSVTSSSANYDESLSSSITSFRLGDKTMNYATWLEETKNSPFFLPEDSTEWESFDPSTPSEVMTFAKSKAIIKNDRKFSVPTYSSNDHANGVKMRDKKDQNAAPSRPSRLIESGASDLKVFEIGNLGEHRPLLSNSTSRGSSQADLLDCPDTPKSPLLSASMVQSGMQSMGSPQVPSRTSRELLDALDSKDEANRRCVSVNDIRRAFEKAEQSLSRSMSKCGSSSSSICGMAPCHNRMSSLDSTASDESSIPTPHYYGSVSSLLSGQTNMKDHYGSITSLASSTSMISPQELQGLIDEANQSLEESGTPSHEIMVIVLHREFTAGSIGITLAGGADYECKDITVHKVIPGTLADRDGRIQKGDRVLSINGRSTKGVSHREALSILKAPRAEVVLVLSRSRSVTPAETGSFDANYAASYNYVNMTSSRPPKILESPLDSKSLLSELKFVDVPRGAPMTVSLKKEGTGLGFRLEGGKDSPLGDRPLTIKKIFTGGAAGKSKVLKVGDEIISVNNTDCTRMSRIEAWNFMKKLSDGTSTIVVRQKIEDVKVKEPVQNCAIEVKAKTAAVTEKASPKQTPTA